MPAFRILYIFLPRQLCISADNLAGVNMRLFEKQYLRNSCFCIEDVLIHIL